MISIRLSPLNIVKPLLTGAILASGASPTFAIEGGTQTYFLGIHDSFAGIVPGPGVYFSNDFVAFSGSAPQLSISGVAVATPKLNAFMWRPNVTTVFKGSVWGATPAFNISLPVVNATIDASGVIGSFAGAFSDDETGFGDLALTGILGWHNGNIHTSAALVLYLPTGKYDDATVNIPARTADIVSLGKNRFAVDPTFSITYFDPKTGWEFSGALGVTISAENSATQYQTAPEFHLEGAVLRHISKQFAFGISGYAFKQFSEDSGVGADNTRAALGATSLKAQTIGLGPMITYSTQIGKTPVSIEAKYIKEFNSRRVFELEKFWLTLGFVF
jgi:hypothetical protein